MSAASAWVARAGRTARRLGPGGDARPHLEVDLGPSLPGWVVRAGAGLAALACIAMVARGPVTAVAGVLLAVMIAARPAGAGPGVLIVAIGGALLWTGAAPFDLRVFALVLLVHVTVWLAALVADLPASAVIEREVVTAAVRPFLALQATGQALAVVAAVVVGTEVTSLWLPTVAALVLAVATWVALAHAQR